jgi:hypothetical protein
VTWPEGEGGQYQGSYPTSPFGAFGAPPHEQSQPGPRYPGGQPPRRRTGLVVGLAVLGALVVLTAVAGAYFVLAAKRTDGAAVASTTTVSTSPRAGGQSATPTGTAKAPAAVVPGWQVAMSSKRKLAYDVPPDWKVLGEDTIIGFEDAEGPKVGMSGAATYKDGSCAESEGATRAVAGFSGYQDTDLGMVAADAAGKWGRYGYLGPADEAPEVDVATATPITVNGIEGAHATATVRITTPAPCAPPAAKVHAVAVPAQQGATVFVILADQETPDSLPDDVALRILDTIRAVP